MWYARVVGVGSKILRGNIHRGKLGEEGESSASGDGGCGTVGTLLVGARGFRYIMEMELGVYSGCTRIETEKPNTEVISLQLNI